MLWFFVDYKGLELQTGVRVMWTKNTDWRRQRRKAVGPADVETDSLLLDGRGVNDNVGTDERVVAAVNRLDLACASAVHGSNGLWRAVDASGV
jgi:hypothetical protein